MSTLFAEFQNIVRKNVPCDGRINLGKVALCSILSVTILIHRFSALEDRIPEQ